MAIVPLVKVTLYGSSADKDAVLDGLQQLGCVHLNDLGSGGAAARDDGAAARAALQYLEDSPVRRPPARPAARVDLQALVRDVLDERDRTHALVEEREQLRKAIADVEPWGDFTLPDWGREGRLRFWFYVVPLHQVTSLPAGNL